MNTAVLNIQPAISPVAVAGHGRRIAVVGLGYVGLPVAVAFARSGAHTVGFDINAERIAELKQGHDRTNEIRKSDLAESNLAFTCDLDALKSSDFFIVTVPTPIDSAHRPDLRALLKASEAVGKVLSPGAVVVFESTVYPGATEEECVPIIEKASGLKCGRDFSVGYSPERINPGDNVHRFETVRKVVSGQDDRTTDLIAEVYGSVVQAGVYKAVSIKVAEAAKVIENTQRDLNISLMNELSLIFHRMGIDTQDVLAAARTKWNFLPFGPGLVGGHCIGVDPFYLTHKAEMLGYHPEVILAGRRINDGMSDIVANECIRLLSRRGIASGAVVVLGLTFKENVPDIRNTKVCRIIEVLRDFGMRVAVNDPLAAPDEALQNHGIELMPINELAPADAVIVAVPHDSYTEQGWDLVRTLLRDGSGIVMDVRSCLDPKGAPDNVYLWRL